MDIDPYEDYFKPLLGLELPPNQWKPRRDVIGEAGQSSAGNTVIRVGRENDPGQGWTESAYLVLSPAERDRLIERLLAHRQAVPATPHEDHRPTVAITRDQLECWSGRPLTDDEVGRLDEAIPNSSIPEAIGTIVDNLR